MNNDIEIEQAMALIRKNNPRLRRSGSVGITHSGGTQTRFGCVCGAEHTCATKWGRNVRHVREFYATHEDCCVDVARKIANA